MQSLRRCFCYYYFLQCKTIFNISIYLFLTSLLNLQGFPFTHSSSCHPQPRPVSLLIPAAPPTKENKTGKQANNKAITKCPPKPKQNQNHSRNRQISSSLLTFYHLFICPDDTGGFGVSYSRPLCLTSSTSKCSLQWSLVWFQVSGFLVQNVHWVLTRATLQYPVAALSLEYLEPASSRAPAGPKWGRC